MLVHFMLSIRWWFSHNDIVINNLVNIKKSSTWILCSDWIKLPFHACTHSKDSFTFQILHKHFSLLVKLVVIGTTSLTTPPQKKVPLKQTKQKKPHTVFMASLKSDLKLYWLTSLPNNNYLWLCNLSFPYLHIIAKPTQ